jgi:serine/threonine-protein phosphatase 2A regulatory subunit B''
MSAAIKMDELLVQWLGSDDVYENVLEWIETYQHQQQQQQQQQPSETTTTTPVTSKAESAGSGSGGKIVDITNHNNNNDNHSAALTEASTVLVEEEEDHIPPFYPVGQQHPIRRRIHPLRVADRWSSSMEDENENNKTPLPPPPPPPSSSINMESSSTTTTIIPVDRMGGATSVSNPITQQVPPPLQPPPPVVPPSSVCARDAALAIFEEFTTRIESVASSAEEQHPQTTSTTTTSTGTLALSPEQFVRITKEVCRFPSYFNLPLYQRILDLYHAKCVSHMNHTTDDDNNNDSDNNNNNTAQAQQPQHQWITMEILEWYWKTEMEPYDANDRFFRLVKQSDADAIVRDDFLPFLKALLADHPGLEFLASHSEFQEKYAVTVITRIFYAVDRCHSGRITSRQVRRSDLLAAFEQVDEEEDINKVTRYFSYEHFYVLYCRFWELDHDRDYRINREDLLKYGDHSLSHMIVDRIFDAAPRPFFDHPPDYREYLSYEDFIYFMLSEEDKANEVSVRYWFTCVDVDGDGCLNNMEMRSFYAVQLHRMQCMGHEIVPFEDMLCQMMDMIKPARSDRLVVEDFLQPECKQVSGALFDALFNLNKYLLFEQRDPFVERQKREDEFDCDWDRFACIDYNRLAMEEEAREEEAMEIDWVTVDDEEEDQQQQRSGEFSARKSDGQGN